MAILGIMPNGYFTNSSLDFLEYWAVAFVTFGDLC